MTDTERARLTHQLDTAVAAHLAGDTTTVKAVLDQMWDEGHEFEAETLLEALLADKLRRIAITTVIVILDLDE